MRTNDAVSGAMVAALGAAFVVASADLSPLPRQEYGAGTFPTVIGTLLLVFGGLMILRGVRSREAWVKWAASAPLTRFVGALTAVAGTVIAYVMLTPIIGFPLLSLAVLTALFYAFHRRHLPLSLAIAGIATLAIWGLFGQLLHVPLELGILEQVIYS